MRLLLVEDDDIDARKVRRALAESGSEHQIAACVRTLADAVEYAAKQPFDALLLDLGLPDATGLECITRLREAAPHALIIVLTGDDDDDRAALALKMGAQDYLPKGAADGSTLCRSLRYARERVAINRELDAQRRQLEEALAELRENQGEQLKLERLRTTAALTHGIAHEFNNALAVISGNIELLALDGTEASVERHELLASAASAAKEASRVATALGAAFGEQRRSGEVTAPPPGTSLQSLIDGLSDSTDSFDISLPTGDVSTDAVHAARRHGAEAPEGAGQVMVVDDEPELLKTLARLLAASSVSAQTFTDPLEALQAFDPAVHVAVLVDRAMPGMRGDQLAAELKDIAPRLPIVMLTGYGAMMQQAGEEIRTVDRVLSKPCPSSLLLDTLEELCPALFDGRRRRAGEQAGLSTRAAAQQDPPLSALPEEALARLTVDWVQTLPDGFAFLDRRLRLRFINAAGAQVLRLPEEQLLGRTREELYPDDAMWEVFENVRRSGRKRRMERFIRPTRRWFAVAAYPSADGVAAYFRDITDEKRLAERITARARADYVGELASGMAHDFNNLISVITACVDAVEAGDQSGEGLQRHLDTVRSAATTGSSVVGRLLRYARQQPLNPQRCNLPTLLADLRPTIAHRLGSDIQLILEIDTELAPIEVDRDELTVALLNLASNARHAMNGEGELRVSAAEFECKAGGTTMPAYVRPGHYAMLRVSDTGQGIAEENLERVLQPYYTTKAERGGTGLGLASALGFMKQSGGYLYLESEPGQGTTVNLLFPTGGKPAARSENIERALTEELGGVRVLVVDDDEFLRAMFCRQLESLGCQAFAARSGQEALDRLENAPVPEVLVADLHLSGHPSALSGTELAKEARRRYPELAVLICTGDTALSVNDTIERSPRPLMKPVQRDQLGERVLEALHLAQR